MAHPYDTLKTTLGIQGEPNSLPADFFLWNPLSTYASDSPDYHPDSPMLAAALFDMMPASYQASALATEEERAAPRYPKEKEIRSFSEEMQQQLKAGKTALDQASTLTKFTAKMRALHAVWIAIIVIIVIVVVGTLLVKMASSENAAKKAQAAPKKSFLDWETSSFL